MAPMDNDEPFCPVVDTFRSIVYAIALANGDDPDEAIKRHLQWSIAQRAHEWVRKTDE